MLEYIIKHWDVETIHNVLDITFDEDHTKVRRDDAPQILSAMRKLALNFIRPMANKWPKESNASIVKLNSTC
ncbi:MAG: hypothetical protein LBV23_03655, partial [Deltaproteobacteria bacterium]|nr:hypothetical protein [Deltaproteobacteria bacterium]